MLLWGKLFGAPNELGNLRHRNFVGDFVSENPVLDDQHELLKGDIFKPEQCYFSIRIVEMRLAKARNYVADILPLCSCFVSFTYAGGRRDIPFMVGHETIREKLGQNAPEDGAKNVEFKNLYVVRNVPLKSDGLTMYAALCQVADSGFARGLLDLLADTATAVGGAAVGVAARTGVDLTKRLGKLLGADGVSIRFGTYDGSALRKSGYRVFAGAPSEGQTIGPLVIENGQLRHTLADGSKVTLDDVDYLVVAFEHRATLIDDNFGQVSLLPFHADFDALRKSISGRAPAIDDAYRKLVASIVSSPDLIEADRVALIGAYQSRAEQLYRQTGEGPVFKGGSEDDFATVLMQLERQTRNKDIAPLLRSVRGTIASSPGIEKSTELAADSDALCRAARNILGSQAMKDADSLTLSRASSRMFSAALQVPLGG